jgi:hypothetical protein
MIQPTGLAPVAQLASGPQFTTYADVQVVSLASQDAERDAAFVAATLGELRHADAELLRDHSRVPEAGLQRSPVCCRARWPATGSRCVSRSS